MMYVDGAMETEILQSIQINGWGSNVKLQRYIMRNAIIIVIGNINI